MNEAIPELDWLAQKKILPSQNYLYPILVENKAKSLVWLINKGIVDPDVAFTSGFRTGSLICLDALVQLGLKPIPGIITHVITAGLRLSVVEWLIKNGFLKQEYKNGTIYLSLNDQ